MNLKCIGILFLSFFLLELIAYAETVYHGSPVYFDAPVLMFNRRIGRNGETLWSGKGVFATPDRRIALTYTNTRGMGYSQGINLWENISENEPIELIVEGGSSQEEALEKLYGTSDPGGSFGYIYCIESKNFKREVGLGLMEVVSRVPVNLIKNSECPDGIQKVNRRAEINRYMKERLIRVIWMPGSLDKAKLKSH